MVACTIAELRPGEKGGYAPRGAALKLWKSRDFETILSGPAETGKTWGCLQYADALLWKYPGAQGVIARKTYNSLIGTAIRTYRRVLGQDSPVVTYGGERPQWFDYPNGSRLWVAGLDKPGKALSSERDFVYVNQAEELTLEDWETLTTRCTGRGAVMPYTRIIGDCNPGPPTHWIKRRPGLVLLESRHEDNPTLFDEGGQITEQGRKTLAILDALTGVRHARLRLGAWRSAEGVVYEGWDAAVHLVDPFLIPPEWPRIIAVDFGFVHPFVAQWWALDTDGRLFRYREIYMTRRLVEDHARDIAELSRGEPAPAAVVCDHDAEDRATLERHLGWETSPAVKGAGSKTLGIQAVAARLRKQADGKPRLFLCRDAVVERDAELDAAKKPCCTEEEFDAYVWDRRMGKAKGEEPVKENDHGLDALRYVIWGMDCGAQPEEDPEPEIWRA